MFNGHLASFKHKNIIPVTEYPGYYERQAVRVHGLCVGYYGGELSVNELATQLNLAAEDSAALAEVMASFGGRERKGGGYMVEHTLRLTQLANDFNIGHRNIVKLAMAHDLQEDAGKLESDITKWFGEEIGRLASCMTEKRLSEDRDRSLFEFVKTLKVSGPIVAQVELLDRLDDISDIGYLTNELGRGNEAKLMDRLAKKFAKCRYTIDQLQIPEVANHVLKLFNEFYKRQINTWHIPLDKIDEYLSIYKRFTGN